MKRWLPNTQNGQTLIALLLFMMLAITITFTAATITVINSSSNNSSANGLVALQAAETGAENGLIRLERDPYNYRPTSSSPDTVTISSNTNATITLSVAGSTYTLTSVGTVAAIGTFVRTVVITATYSNNVFTVTSWVESP